MSWQNTLKKNFIANEREHMRRRQPKSDNKDNTEMQDSPCDICGKMKLRNHEDSMGDVCLDCYWEMSEDKRRAL